MCGICLAFVKPGFTSGERAEQIIHSIKTSCLVHRGQDAVTTQIQQLVDSSITSIWCGCTLHFRGSLTPQPLVDGHGNMLLWNGEIFGGFQVTPSANDGAALLEALSRARSNQEVLTVVTQIEGPFSFIYWDNTSCCLWFGRDFLGRRSLLVSSNQSGTDLLFASVAIDTEAEWIEVPASGVYSMKFNKRDLGQAFYCVTVFPWQWRTCDKPYLNITDFKDFMSFQDDALALDFLQLSVKHEHNDTEISIPTCVQVSPLDKQTKSNGNFDKICQTFKSHCMVKLGEFMLTPRFCPFRTCLPSESLTQILSEPKTCMKKLEIFYNKLADQLTEVLLQAVRRRIECQSTLCGGCIKAALQAQSKQDKAESKKIESPVISFPAKPCGHCRVAVLYSGGIDSLFIAALADRCVPKSESIDLLNVAFQQPIQHDKTASKSKEKTGEGNDRQLAEEDPFHVPDRQTGKAGLSVLNRDRNWRFVQINVTKEELQTERTARVQGLVYPLNTVLDDSIGCAVWFAARGQGIVWNQDEHTHEPYTSTARVVLVGMGADEQLGGYSRHRQCFMANGWPGMVEEIQMEVQRISARNLGRDDRIISDHGKEARFPFLDEHVVSFLNNLPIWCKANLNLERGYGEKLLLRLAASRLGLGDCSWLAKRAIQFGSRIAKMENRKEKASDVCDRLK